MKIKNPLDKDISLRYKGKDYVLEAGVSKEFPEDVIAQWITIYGFLSIAKGTDKETDAVVEVLQEEKEEAGEIKKKPAKKSTKKKVSAKKE